MNAMNVMKQFLVEDHIHGLEHEAERLRAERARNRRTIESGPCSGDDAGSRACHGRAPRERLVRGGSGHDRPRPSTRVRLGRWLVSVGAAIAGATVDETDAVVRIRGRGARWHGIHGDQGGQRALRRRLIAALPRRLSSPPMRLGLQLPSFTLPGRSRVNRPDPRRDRPGCRGGGVRQPLGDGPLVPAAREHRLGGP